MTCSTGYSDGSLGAAGSIDGALLTAMMRSAGRCGSPNAITLASIAASTVAGAPSSNVCDEMTTQQSPPPPPPETTRKEGRSRRTVRPQSMHRWTPWILHRYSHRHVHVLKSRGSVPSPNASLFISFPSFPLLSPPVQSRSCFFLCAFVPSLFPPIHLRSLKDVYVGLFSFYYAALAELVLDPNSWQIYTFTLIHDLFWQGRL